MIHGLTIDGQSFSRLALPRENNIACSTCLYLLDNTSCSKYGEAPILLRGPAFGNDVSASIRCWQQEDFRQCKLWRQTKYEHVTGGYPHKP